MEHLPISIHVNAAFLLGALAALVMSGSRRFPHAGKLQILASLMMFAGVVAAASIICDVASCNVHDVGMYRFALDMFSFSALLMAIRMIIIKTTTRVIWLLTGCLGISFKISEVFLSHICSI